MTPHSVRHVDPCNVDRRRSGNLTGGRYELKARIDTGPVEPDPTLVRYVVMREERANRTAPNPHRNRATGHVEVTSGIRDDDVRTVGLIGDPDAGTTTVDSTITIPAAAWRGRE